MILPSLFHSSSDSFSSSADSSSELDSSSSSTFAEPSPELPPPTALCERVELILEGRGESFLPAVGLLLPPRLRVRLSMFERGSNKSVDGRGVAGTETMGSSLPDLVRVGVETGDAPPPSFVLRYSLLKAHHSDPGSFPNPSLTTPILLASWKN